MSDVSPNVFRKHGKSAAIGGITGTAAALVVAMLTTWEGMDLTAQHQRIDPPGVITACIGQTNYDDPSLRVGQRFTPAECKERLLHDIPKYDQEVRRCIHVQMSDGTYAAVLSLTYNIGGGRFCKSTVARRLNAGDLKGACDAFLLFDRANGKVLKGLKNRRQDERRLCLA